MDPLNKEVDPLNKEVDPFNKEGIKDRGGLSCLSQEPI